jgi:phospholipase C
VNFGRVAATAAALSLIAPAVGSAGVPAAHVQSATRSAAAAQRAALIASLRSRVKYVFVLYQENRSFDSYFGTFPNADGIYSQPASTTPGYSQPIENVDGTYSSIVPFRIGPAQYAADTDDVNHSHPGLVAKIDVTAGGPQMDKFALTEEALHTTGALPTLEAKQYGELTMAHEDCDTIPLLWNYANRFTLFDHIFQSAIGPSTPGNLTIIGAQAGETQYGLHPTEGYTGTGASGPGVPVTNDANPAWAPTSASGTQINLTFATLPLSLAGPSIGAVVASDPTSTTDFADTTDDVKYLKGQPTSADWAWFQEGYSTVPNSPDLANYIAHHNGPQYFGYVANSSERAKLHNLPDFFATMASDSLPNPGVYYVKGGYQNILGLAPVAPFPAVQTGFAGDDDHPGYSDAQISEAAVATAVNAIVKSKYWSQSAIIITWDDSEGDYDHVPPPLTAIGPGAGNLPQDFITAGPRVPLMVISPFAKDHAVLHGYGDQGSVVKFVDTVFGVTPLANLPDEIKGRYDAAALGKINYGPDDGAASGTTDLLEAFDYGRLAGYTAPLTKNYAYTPVEYITTLPQTSGRGCKNLGIVPVDYARGIANQIPADFNPRPGSVPTTAGVKPVNTREAVRKAADLDD